MKRCAQLAALDLLSTVGEGTFATYLGLRQLDWSESSWASIEPSKELAWVKCYNGGLECTRLQVPLNYSDPEDQSAAIAIVRLKANTTDSPNYLGPTLCFVVSGVLSRCSLV
ncbi:hypothetical protein VNI00_013125 [Paramarasmius palmivorus]|uniref:Uncharacterized protein n=1 Tax=Paramarasmius palmivorus TaxID=297713 RepID=A0AAW0C1P1_9AGAR